MSMHCWRVVLRSWMSSSPGFSTSWSPTVLRCGTTAELSKLYLSYSGHEVVRAGKFAGDHKAIAVYMPSRPFLECHVRRRLQAIANVTILGGQDVAELTSTADRNRVTGVRVVNRDDGAEQELTADLVMDAMGRGAHTPAFLESLGYGRPVEDHIVMHTTYVSQLLRIPPGTLKEMLAHHQPRAGPAHWDVSLRL